jgi:hypothetical protein
MVLGGAGYRTLVGANFREQVMKRINWRYVLYVVTIAAFVLAAAAPQGYGG